MSTLRLLGALALAAFIPLTTGCPGEQTSTSSPDAEDTVVVYCGRSENLVRALLERFETESGIDLEIRYAKTPELAVRLAQEGDTSEADVFFAQDSGYLGALAKQGLLRELDAAIVEQTDASLRAPERRWVATSGRARVLVYNPKTVDVKSLPRSLKDLPGAATKGKLGWAPTNGSFQAHVSALRHLWGEAETEAWLKGIKALEPVRYRKNSPQVKAVSSGEIQIGWVNHYYLHKIRASDPDLVAANWSFPSAGDAGNLLMLSGAGITTHARRPAAAAKLLAFLVSEAAQTHFAQSLFEYPTRPGVATHADVPKLEALQPVQVDQAHLTDLEPTLEMLQRLGLL